MFQRLNPTYRVTGEEESSAELATSRRSESVALRARTKGSGNKAEQSDRWEGEQREGRREDREWGEQAAGDTKGSQSGGKKYTN